LSATGRTPATIPNPTGTLTLTRDKVWTLTDFTYVAEGQTLTIEPCTRIEGAKSPLGTLIVSRGGKIIANGTADSPILFTSQRAPGQRAKGDWGGVVLLGRAPNFIGNQVNIEGLASAPQNQHGGNDPADSSGSMKYVIIEYPGYVLSGNNEINGLTFGSVGNQTVIENILVNSAADDCFEWFGGTVNGKYLVCQSADDDMFDTDYGYTGSLEYLFGRQMDTTGEDGSNGLEVGWDRAGGINPAFNTKVTFDKVTNCGPGANVPLGDGVAMRLRQNIEGSTSNTLANYIGLGFDYALNVDADIHPGIVIHDSLLWGMFADAGSQLVSASDNDTADGNFDEAAWFTAGTNNSVPGTPPFSVADCQAADGPAGAVKTSNVGAFKDNATWLDWVRPQWWLTK
jgi:hypothetical protein